MLKNKKVLIGIALIALLAIGGGGYYVMGMNAQKPVETAPVEEDMTVQTLSPEELGLTFEFRKDGHAGKIILTNIKGIKAMEYQVSYQKSEEGEDIPEGLYGEIDMKTVANGKIETEYRDFGSCSSGKCRYHVITSPIKVTLKITKDDGKVYQSEKSFDLPEK